MTVNFLLILALGTLPLFVLTGFTARLIGDKPIERDIVFRLFFAILFLFPCIGLVMPRWSVLPLAFETTEEVTSITQIPQPEKVSTKTIEMPVFVEFDPISPPPIISQEDFPIMEKADVREFSALPVSDLPILPEVAEVPSPPEVTFANVQEAPPVVPTEQANEKITQADNFLQMLWVKGTTICLTIWLAGMIPWLVLLIKSRVIYAAILRKAEPLCDGRWVDLCRELETTLQLKRRICYRVSREIAVPQVVGLRQPTVLLPHHLIAEKPNRAVLIHELAHIRRNDIAWQLLMSVVCMMYWFQPLVWFFAAAMRNTREEACDNDVLQYGEKGSDYAAVLLDLSLLVQRGYRLPERIGCAVTMPSRKNQVERRIMSLLDPKRKRGPIPMKTKLALTVSMILAGLFSLTICPAWEMPQKNQPAQQAGPQQPIVPENAANDNDIVDPQSIGVQEIPTLNVGESSVPMHGLVQWEDKTPVAGANVTMITDAGQQLDLKSDAQGRFLFWACPNARWNQNIRMIARAERAENNREIRIGMAKTNGNDKEYVITLREGRSINGTVTSSSDKALEEFYVGTREYGFSRVSGKNDFSLLIPAGDDPIHLYAWADGEGLAYKIFKNDDNRAGSENDPLYVELDQSIEMTLEGAAPLTIQTIDTDANNIVGIGINIWGVAHPPYMVNGELKTPQPISLPQPVTTDENGTATIEYFPSWANGRLTISPVQFYDGPYLYTRTKEFWPNFAGKPMYVVQEFAKNIPVRGTVRYPDGQPVVGLGITAVGQGMTLNDRWNKTTTDAEGKYEFLLPPYQWYAMAAKPTGDWAFPTQDGFAILPGDPVESFDVVVEPATKVTIKVLSHPERTPLANRKVSLTFSGRSDHGIERIGLTPVPEKFHLPIYRGKQANQYPDTTCGNYTTDADGNISVSLGSGCYEYRLEDAREHDHFGVVSTFEIKYDPEHPEIVREILVPSQEESLFSGTALVQMKDGTWQGAAGLEVSISDPPVGHPGKSIKKNHLFPCPKTNTDGKFSFMRANQTMRILVYDPKTEQAAYATVSASQNEIELKLQPLVSITGTIVNLETGEPLKGISMEYRFRYECDGDISCGRNWMSTPASEKMFYQNATTDEHGRYVINSLLPDQMYDLHYDRSAETNERFDFWQIGGFRTPTEQEIRRVLDLPADSNKALSGASKLFQYYRPYEVGVIRVASLKPIGVQNIDKAEQQRPAGDEGSIADNLRRAREKTEPEYAWSRISNYKNAIFGLIAQEQWDAGKAATTEMVELVVSTRKALREKGVRFDEERFDEDLYAVATALEAKGEKEAGAEVRKHLEKLDDVKILQQTISQFGAQDNIDNLDSLIDEIETKVPDHRKDGLFFDLFINGCRDKALLTELVEKVRKLNDTGAKIQILAHYADDYRREGDEAKSNELFDEVIDMLKNLPTASERSLYWSDVMMYVRRKNNMELMHQAAIEIYDRQHNNKLKFDPPDPKIDLEKAKIPGSEEYGILNRLFGSFLIQLHQRTLSLDLLVKVGEKEKAIELADEIVSFKDFITKEQLVACGWQGFLEGALATCAETYANCDEIEKAKETWQAALDLLAIGPDAESRPNASWPVVLSVRNPLFREDVRKLCLQTVEEMKTFEDEDRPELTFFRRIDNTKSRAFALARYGFTDDARRVLDELWAAVQKDVSDLKQLDYYRADIADGYANARFADKARELAESIEDEALRTKTLKSITVTWDW